MSSVVDVVHKGLTLYKDQPNHDSARALATTIIFLEAYEEIVQLGFFFLFFQ